jgi:DNA excision repair protein ERCC-6
VAQVLLAQLVSFLSAQGGTAPSAVLVDHFQPLVGAGQMPLFKQLLRQVAALQRGRQGAKQWVLKEEYAT